jgi:hypothetical protein
MNLTNVKQEDTTSRSNMGRVGLTVVLTVLYV